jgi:5-formyltetrahydrofolate cyclo-ligase
MTVREDKRAWRLRLRAARRAQPNELRAVRGAALAAAVVEIAEADAAGRPVCAYVPIGTEPAWAAGLDGLRTAGHEVLLPIVPIVPGPLDWACYEGLDTLSPGPFGLREPTGERLGTAAVARARLVLVPALAVDRRGVRLGQGGGHYDRSLPLAAPDAEFVVILNDEELVDTLPVEPHDHRVHRALLADSGPIALR